AQLRAVRRLRKGSATREKTARKTRLSQVDMAYDVLKKAHGPLHVSELLDRIHSAFGVRVDRESLVSSLTKRSPGAIASFVARRTLSICVRSHDDTARGIPRDRGRLARDLSAKAFLSAGRAPSVGLVGLSRASDFVTHHLDQWRAAAQLE